MLLRPQTARSASVSEKWNHAMTSGDGVIVFWEQQWNEADSQNPDARSTCCARSSGICSRALSRRDGSAQRGPWLGNGRTCGPVADGPRPAGSRGADVALVAVPQVRLAAAGGPGVAREGPNCPVLRLEPAIKSSWPKVSQRAVRISCCAFNKIEHTRGPHTLNRTVTGPCSTTLNNVQRR